MRAVWACSIVTLFRDCKLFEKNEFDAEEEREAKRLQKCLRPGMTSPFHQANHSDRQSETISNVERSPSVHSLYPHLCLLFSQTGISTSTARLAHTTSKEMFSLRRKKTLRQHRSLSSIQPRCTSAPSLHPSLVCLGSVHSTVSSPWDVYAGENISW